jgi:hypothetical protein
MTWFIFATSSGSRRGMYRARSATCSPHTASRADPSAVRYRAVRTPAHDPPPSAMFRQDGATGSLAGSRGLASAEPRPEPHARSRSNESYDALGGVGRA